MSKVCTSKFWSTSWPTKAKFIESLDDTRTSLKENGISPNAIMGGTISLVV
jgi:hypothetical protein